ncbi:MAG: bifunctional UDP-sugar hydrolase/5'-nucleotidase [Chloroflexota bacterium]
MKHSRFVMLCTSIVWLLLAVGCQPLPMPEGEMAEPQVVSEPVTITILNTADEHGWLQTFSPFRSGQTLGGAANVYSWWLEKEQFDPDSFLILSGGDNWTGPSISTWFEGESAVEVFNLMGYHASVIGNHEFDFGREAMTQRFAEANFPYLAANVRDKATGELADFAQPYAIFQVSGVTVGVLGLSTTETATTTHPKNIGDLTFAGYSETLTEYLPQLQADGAEIVLILGHVCMDELAELAEAQSGDVHAMFAGHCNDFDAQMVNGISVMGSGAKFAGYVRLDITYDPAAAEVLEMQQTLVPVSYVTDDGNPVMPSSDIVEVVDGWQMLVDEQLNETIGYTEAGLAQREHPMANLVMDAWLWSNPSAQIAVTNWGGFRAEVPTGDITWGSVIDVLPFDNNLVTVDITGAQLAENLLCCGGAVGGISYQLNGDSVDITLADGSDLALDSTYTVIINDFMYAGGDDYLFGEQDPDGYDTNVHWRQPVIDYILSLETSEAQPLDALLDESERVQLR